MYEHDTDLGNDISTTRVKYIFVVQIVHIHLPSKSLS